MGTSRRPVRRAPFLSVIAPYGPFLCYTIEVELPLIVGIGAFIILGIMFALLWVSTKRDEEKDTVTREVIIKAQTGTISVQAEIGDATQEEEN